MTGPRHRAAPPPPPPPPAPAPEELLPCPCCGHRTPGELWAYEICPVCYWEEDPFQLRHPTAGTGPNHGLNLIEAQANYRRLGAVTEEMRRYVRPPREDEPLDPGFRPADPDRDPFEQGPAGTPMPDDLTGLYYWRPTYWRRHLAP
ncbi:CPCC family cysteine-rich protein [Streptomyces cahuitamycinicus]|uniref:Hydrolase n=1 Tax=Streptomyces cahuitamycinicus TaxID=2070367 RepID=A0A2N8TFU5_9ACTN|nr:CPCC family cysteine-rich protein [Streptomyces cahuitamycinicus]PNG17910.1 hydrolase [Streptomyces cahuitamycinicus]